MKVIVDLRLAICDWRVWRKVMIVLAFVFVVNSRLYTQTGELQAYIEKLESGQTEEVKKALPDLVAKYQNDPGILYLQGRLATDGIEAVKFYQSVVDNFPKSDWADDALYRIHQYYYALGLYRTADLKLQQLKKEYPNSPYVTGKPVVKFPEKDEAVVNLPPKESPLPVDTSQSEETNPAPTNEPYTLQVGAFSTVANAEKQKSFFEDLGYAVEITNKVRGGRSLFLVWVGNFKTADRAREFGNEVRIKYNIDSIVVERY
ncbi:MAG: SPOR domain-containing protein [Ignavibacteriae bacterium]|nr:SPOR domain-containing protein [Ignavibacteriota bacterium]